jgi:LPS sulfotransferase NodH
MDFPEKKLVVFATQRSGSTLLCEDLRSYGVFGFPDEHFLLMMRRHAPADWPKELKAAVTKHAENGDVLAFKLMVNYADSVDRYLAESGIVPKQGGDTLFPHVASFLNGAEWIWIRRRDIVRQAVSREMSRQTGVNHAVDETGPVRFLGRAMAGYDSGYNTEAVLEVDAILESVTSIAMEEALIERFFQQHGIDYFTVWYEDYVEHYRAVLTDFAARFGTDIGDTPPKRRLVKLSNEKNEHYVKLATEEIVRRVRVDL